MKQLYLPTTYYQMIAAIQIKTKVFPNSEADLILTDNSNGFQKAVKRLQETGIFTKVFAAISTDDLSVNTGGKKIIRIMDILNNKEYLPLENRDQFTGDYDEFLFFNFNYLTTSVYYYLWNRNPRLICRRFEEGFTSGFDFKIYTTRSSWLQEKTRHLHNNPSIYNVEEMFFYEPDMVLFDRNLCRVSSIPKIQKDDAEIKEALNFIFDYTSVDEYKERYIFFEESHNVDGVEIDDLDLVLKIAEKVGPDNLIVKLHPRSRKNRFSEYGIKTNNTWGIPWEIVILNNKFIDKVFLTVTSGSVLSPRIIFGENVPTFMLYNCIKTVPPLLKDRNFGRYISSFRKKYGEDGFYIPGNINEFWDQLKTKGLYAKDYR